MYVLYFYHKMSVSGSLHSKLKTRILEWKPDMYMTFRLFLHYSNITNTLLDKDYIKFNFI